MLALQRIPRGELIAWSIKQKNKEITDKTLSLTFIKVLLEKMASSNVLSKEFQGRMHGGSLTEGQDLLGWKK